MTTAFTTAFFVLIGVLWFALVAAILLQTREEKRRAEQHIAALRRLQFVAEPGTH